LNNNYHHLPPSSSLLLSVANKPGYLYLSAAF
jgi:hypothetical protein